MARQGRADAPQGGLQAAGREPARPVPPFVYSRNDIRYQRGGRDTDVGRPE